MHKIQSTSWYTDSPLKHALDINLQSKSPMGKYYRKEIESEGIDPVHRDIANQMESTKTSGATRMLTYMSLNKSLVVHPVYHGYKVPEYQRVIFTQYRLGSHRLMVERGRWTRTPREERVCPCNNINVQDEHHVLCECNITKQARIDHGVQYHSLQKLMEHEDICQLTKYVYTVNRLIHEN